jgi:hypothetical protein
VSRKHFPLRIDPLLWAEIERLAAADLRSVNAEVEVLLREAVKRRAGDEQRPRQRS